MKILSVTAQKPHSTGSGVYLTELVRGFHKLGHKQAVITGVYEEDRVDFPVGVAVYPVYYNSTQLPFPIAGMSDEMPYESTVYSEMTEEMAERFRAVFTKQLKCAVTEFQPDLILCHHLYFLTAIVRELFPHYKVAGICHGTCLRQMKKHSLQKDYIKGQIKKLDMLFVLQEEQKRVVQQFYHIEATRVQVVGSGFNQELFYAPEDSGRIKDTLCESRVGIIRLIYAGKLSEKKGVMSLLKCLTYLGYQADKAALYLAGGAGNQQELSEIRELSAACRYPVKLLGKLSQEQLAEQFRSSAIFVLPSFYEGLPLVILEALACGLKVVTTDLPGIRPWLEQNIPDNQVIYVRPPALTNIDEPVAEELPEFEKRFALGIEQAVSIKAKKKLDLRGLSWEGVCRKMIKGIFGF